MSRLLHLILGPELYWLLVYGATRLLAGRNVPPTESGNQFLEQLGMWILPLATVPLSFWLVFGLLPGPSSRGWMAARLALATLIGLNACLIHLIEAIDYHDSRNSGVLGVWVVGAGLGTVLFFAGIIIMSVFWWKGKHA